MKFMTMKEARAALCEEDAIELCRKHWKQVLTATKGDILAYASTHDHGLMSARLCALCNYHDDVCEECALNSLGHHCGRDSQYKSATIALHQLIIHKITLKRFRELCQPVLDAIEELCV